MENKQKILRAYLSGPISGYDMNERRKAFSEAEEFIREPGVEVVSPLNNGLPDDAEWSDHMLRDLEMLIDCDMMVLLPGWEHSRGCLTEVRFARKMGLLVLGYGNDEQIAYERYCKENPVKCWKQK